MAKSQYPIHSAIPYGNEHLSPSLFQQQIKASYNKLRDYLDKQLKAATKAPEMNFWTKEQWSVDRYKGTTAYTALKSEAAAKYKTWIFSHCFKQTDIQQFRMQRDGTIVMAITHTDSIYTSTATQNASQVKATPEQQKRLTEYNQALKQLSFSIDTLVSNIIDDTLEAVKTVIESEEYKNSLSRRRCIPPLATTILYGAEAGIIAGIVELYTNPPDGWLLWSYLLTVMMIIPVFSTWVMLSYDSISSYITLARHEAIDYSPLNRSKYQTQCTIWQQEGATAVAANTNAAIDFEKLTNDMANPEIAIGLKIGLLREALLLDRNNLQRLAAQSEQ